MSCKYVHRKGSVHLESDSTQTPAQLYCTIEPLEKGVIVPYACVGNGCRDSVVASIKYNEYLLL